MNAVANRAQASVASGAVALPRRGLSREASALYIGVGVTKFDEMIHDGRMPKPKRIDGRVVWDIRALDAAFDDLPGGADDDSWGDL